MYKYSIILFTILLAGCSTSYSGNSFWNGGGFSETEVQPNVFNVRFLGNEYTSTEKTSDFALLRASELCLNRNLTHMQIGNVTTETMLTGHIPASTTTTEHVFRERNATHATVTTTHTPGTDLYSAESGLTVECVSQKADDTLDAVFLSNSLRAKYSIE